MTQSARYTIRRLWDAVPVLTTNLLETGLVDQNFNDSLTRSALKAFDIYISTHHHDRKVSHGLPFFQDNSPPPLNCAERDARATDSYDTDAAAGR